MPFPKDIPKKLPLQPGIRHLTNLVQIYPHDISRVKDYFQDELKTEFDKKRLLERAECALNWVTNFSPDDFKFTIQEKVSDNIKKELSEKEKKALLMLANSLSKEWTEQTLFEEFYKICKSTEVNNKDFFKVAYKVLIDKEKGPKLATLIIEIGVKKVAKILSQI